VGRRERQGRDVTDEDHARLFAFEQDFVDTLHCVPMAVRLKLDRAGIKLTLRQWSRFAKADRGELLARPCRSPDEIAAYRGRLQALVDSCTGEVARPLDERVVETWLSPTPPAAIQAFASARGLPTLTETAWRALSELERFALTKLCRENHDNVNFVPALREFHIL
jgi:hypothetical protein